MRAGQVWHWLYHRGAQSFAEMTNIAKDLRQRLEDEFVIGRPEIVTEQVSNDGTRKWLLRLSPDERGARHEVEMVYIPEEDRGTLCISSQVGCTLDLHFLPYRHAETGAQPDGGRNRLPGDDRARPGEGLAPRHRSQPHAAASGGRYITNVVLMGMGEPLYNFDNVKDAMEIVSDGEGISLSKRRITLSTSGVVPEIPRAGEEIGTMLAISLHGTTDEIRDKLVPLNKKYPIKELLAACRNYPGALQRAAHHLRICDAEGHQ